MVRLIEIEITSGLKHCLLNLLVWILSVRLCVSIPLPANVDSFYVEKMDCSQLLIHMTNCLHGFTEHYEIFVKLPDNQVTDAVLQNICRSYGEGLQCLHNTFQTCPPENKHLDYLETNLPDPSIMLPLCYPAPGENTMTTEPGFSQDIATMKLDSQNEVESPNDKKSQNHSHSHNKENLHSEIPITENSIKILEHQDNSLLDDSNSKANLDKEINQQADKSNSYQQRVSVTEKLISHNRKDCTGSHNCAGSELSTSNVSRIHYSWISISVLPFIAYLII